MLRVYYSDNQEYNDMRGAISMTPLTLYLAAILAVG